MELSRRGALGLGLAAAAAGAAGCAASNGGAGSTVAGSATAAAAGSASASTAASTATIELNCTSEMAGAELEDLQAWIESSVYNEDAQAEVMARLDAAKSGQTLDAPLVEYNPFGTNTLGLYVYFCTDEPASVSYTAAADGAEELTCTVDDDAATTEHEFQVVGLVPNSTCTVRITATEEGDGAEQACSIACTMGDALDTEPEQLSITESASDAELAPGLYAILGNETSDAYFMYCYDNQGVLRSETPVMGYRSHRQVFDSEGTLYFSASESCIAAMSPAGQITRVYDLSPYTVHHDYVLGAEGELLLLASEPANTETTEDLVARLDLKTGEVSLALDMGDLLPTLREETIEYYLENNDVAQDEDFEGVNWIHLNSIQHVDGEDAIIVSSHATSSIIKVGGVDEGEPEIEYILGSKEFWEGTGAEGLVFSQEGEFTLHGGQHCVEYEGAEGLSEGQHYLRLFNNNIATMLTTSFDFTALGIGQEGEDGENHSYSYRYLVDEVARTFELVESVEVPFSAYVSSSQEVDGNLVVDCGSKGEFTEYDEDREAIRTFSMGDDAFLYRVFKYQL